MLEWNNEIETHQIILNTQEVYDYIIQPAEIKNALGAIAAILNEYRFSQNGLELFRLFRTKEGNWYEFPDDIASNQLSLVIAIKSGIEKEEIANHISKVA